MKVKTRYCQTIKLSDKEAEHLIWTLKYALNEAGLTDEQRGFSQALANALRDGTPELAF